MSERGVLPSKRLSSCSSGSSSVSPRDIAPVIKIKSEIAKKLFIFFAFQRHVQFPVRLLPELIEHWQRLADFLSYLTSINFILEMINI